MDDGIRSGVQQCEHSVDDEQFGPGPIAQRVSKPLLRRRPATAAHILLPSPVTTWPGPARQGFPVCSLLA